jgi:tRNA threonylcarbamoyladenosine biosynthesis protein TsaE
MRVDEAGLIRWGERIGATVETPVVLALLGPLGAGKSVLARAIGSGAGVRESMPSPTFNLLLRYPARLGREVVHLDLYRIKEPDELWELGWEQLGGPNEIVIVEWPENGAHFLPPDYWLIDLSVPPGRADYRDVEVVRHGHPPPLAAFPMSLSGPAA